MTTTYRSVSMSFVRALAARVFRNKRRDREELDIWRLYHFISYRKQISEGAKEATDLKYPNQRASYKKQYSTVHSAVTQQVSLRSRYRCTYYSEIKFCSPGDEIAHNYNIMWAELINLTHAPGLWAYALRYFYNSYPPTGGLSAEPWCNCLRAGSTIILCITGHH